MGHEELDGILDNLFEKHLEVVPQTCNHSLQMSPSDQLLFGCHEALLFSQVLATPWEFSSAEHHLVPVTGYN